MSKIALFVPTYRPGGIDVFSASIQRQSVKPDIIMVADELIKERHMAWKDSIQDVELICFQPEPILPGNKRNLCANYNRAASRALDRECDLFITLQDYIWIPEFGIERFLNVHQNKPDDLITGVTHISKDPLPKSIRDLNGLYTIFKTPFFDKPQSIDWRDVRQTELYPGEAAEIFPVYPDHWEANWAAVPVSVFGKGIWWNEDYDQGIAYENADFAQTVVQELGANVWFDKKNEAISLPHKDYFEGEREDIIKYTNRWRYEAAWGD